MKRQDGRSDTEAMGAAAVQRPHGAALVAVIIPTFNERANVEALVEAVGHVFGGIAWEIVFVDDDSPDGTADSVAQMAAEHSNVRCLHRIGRRGLASAVVEGLLSVTAPYAAVMDADFQHDEKLLPQMLAAMQTDKWDLVVGSRLVEGGSLGEWSARRRRMSSLATRLSHLIINRKLEDPMSGFFMIRREAFLECVYDLSQQGYKVLLDIIASSPRPLRITELPYQFRNRRAGESKVDLQILVEYGMLLVDKLSSGLVPPRFVLFALTGGLGLGVHLGTLYLLKQLTTVPFVSAQETATFIAMLFNFVVNNVMTYRDVRLRGTQFWTGLLLFCGICSIGAMANIGVAALAYRNIDSWALAGFAGALIGAVFNFAMASSLVWRRKPRRGRRTTLAPIADVQTRRATL
ncbi:MAG: dolichol-phosphate mannosyltransferase [Rhodospirillaceae bacterium]|jgi:dolichol-phosphate mannosyltransferase|nr:dolichol-phosphate mannosyltransferase [Rhodospirillaceae bacterium]